MMDYPLLLKSILYRGYTVFPEKEIVSRDYGGIFRYTYADLHRRVCQLANALDSLGVEPGARVASFAWNSHRHLELYYAVPCSQRVLHTVNIRLFPEQIVYAINHAEDQVVFVDADLVPVMEALADRLPSVRAYVIMTDSNTMPETSLTNAVLYEGLIAQESAAFDFPEFDEQETAILGYTSATTGDPKGVEYSHRALYLHCLTCLSGQLGVDEPDVTMPIVPMFHVNAWGRPYIDTWAGCKQVYPGPRPTAEVLCDLIHTEKVTFSAGVPTIWMGVLGELRAHPEKYDFSHVRFFMSGGAAMPEALTRAYDQMGIRLYQGYGQTETTPVTFINVPKSTLSNLSEEDEFRRRVKTGLIMPGLEMRLIDADGREVPHDGRTMGELLLRGPWVLSEYYKDEEKTREAMLDGWFRTGDIATMDAHGYLQVVDRTKDLIKSGGEWISSVDLENALMGHPDVAEAAVIGIADEKWQERPLACVVQQEGKTVTAEELRTYLLDHVAKWWIPEQFVFIAEIPKTSVGKFSKRTLRGQYETGVLLTE